MRNRLDNKNIELGKILYETKACLDLDRLLGLNAGEITEKGTGKYFFSFVQGLVLKAYAINICKIYEKEDEKGRKAYTLNSVFGILNFIKKSNLKPSDFSYIQSFVNKNNGSIAIADDCYEKLTSLVESFMCVHSKDFKLYKTWRDKHIAHAEDAAAPIKSLSCYDTMEKILFFAIDFYSMITNGFLENISPLDYQHETYTITSFFRLLERIGCEDFKRDFVDNK